MTTLIQGSNEMKIPRTRLTTTIVLSLSSVIGCSAILNDPIYDSVTRSVESEDLTNELKSYQIGWLSQALLEPQTRNEIAKKLFEHAPQVSSDGIDAVDTSLSAQMVTDLATGQLDSGAGNAVGAAIFVGATALSLLEGDGSYETTTVVLIPEVLNNEEIKSAAQAKTAAEKLIVKSYTLAAEKFGYSFVCEHSCEAFPSVYRMQRKVAADNHRFLYAAKDVAIYFEDFEMIAPDKTQAVDSIATGFKVAWRSNFNNDADAYFMQNPILDSNNKVQIIQTDKMTSGWGIRGDDRFVKTDFGQIMLREVYSNPYMIFGLAKNYPKVSYYNGVVYRYTLNSSPNAFNGIVLPFGS